MVADTSHYLAQTQDALTITDEQPIDDQHKTELRAALNHLRQGCKAIGLPFTLLAVERLEGAISERNSTAKDLAPIFEELHHRFMDELRSIVVVQLPTGHADYFVKPLDGWEEVIARFPDSIRDVEEMRKSFALARYAASVFHSVQAIEVGLIALGTFMAVADPLPGWTATTNALKAVVQKKHPDRSAFEKQHYPFIEQMHGTTEALKNAWRNKISHVQGRLVVLRGDFTPDVAEEIMMASRAFLRRLATDLPVVPR